MTFEKENASWLSYTFNFPQAGAFSSLKSNKSIHSANKCVRQLWIKKNFAKIRSNRCNKMKQNEKCEAQVKSGGILSFFDRPAHHLPVKLS